MDWAMTQPAETAELVVSLLIELDDALDEVVDELLTVDENAPVDLSLTVAEARDLVDDRFGWIAALDEAGRAATTYRWVYSDNTEEPRRVRRDRLDVADQAMALDIAARMADLRRSLASWPDEARV